MSLELHTEKKDLFSVPATYRLAHCISSDFALGAGIAKEFDRRYNMRDLLYINYHNYQQIYNNNNIKGDCLPIGRVYNLVTKPLYYNKPTYKSLRFALERMRFHMINEKVTKLAMPKIGCGLDKLEWTKVLNIIIEVFENYPLSLDIIICEL